jgi:pimeloyl-ACP methyl ester carboxylesterase
MSEGRLALHVETAGRDPGPSVETFVLIHGYGASRFSWRHWTPALAHRGHVVLVDLKGFGAAHKPPDDLYSPNDQAELVVRMLRERDLGNLTLIGHSLGGAVSLLTAMSLADRGLEDPRRMVIVAGAAYEQPLPPFVWLAERPRLSAALMRLLGPRRVVRHVLRSVVHDPETIEASVVDGYATPLASDGSLRALIRTARQIVPQNLEEVVGRYPRLDIPTLLIWGRHDRVVPLWVGEKLAGELPRARLEILEACGHLPAEETPTESLAAVEAFLNAYTT